MSCWTALYLCAGIVLEIARWPALAFSWSYFGANLVRSEQTRVTTSDVWSFVVATAMTILVAKGWF